MDTTKRSVICALLAVITLTSAASLSTVSAEWLKTEKGTSYTDENGKVKGWQTIDGKRYYFNNDGFAVTGLRKIGGKTYYFGKDGGMKTGKVKINGKTYDFGKNGVLKSDNGTKMVVKKKTPAKTSQTDDTGIKWGVDAQGMRDWRLDAVNVGKEGSDTLFLVREEPLETIVFSVNDKTGLYKVSESGIANSVKDERWLLGDKGYELWFETTVDDHTVYAYKKAGVVVFTAGVRDDAENPPGNVTYKTVTVSPAYAKTLDENKAKAVAKKEFTDVFHDKLVKKAAGTASVKEPTSKYMVTWYMSREDLGKQIEAEKKKGRDAEWISEDGIEGYYRWIDEGTVMFYEVSDATGVNTQTRMTFGRSLGAEQKDLKSAGFTAWKTYKKKDGSVYVYKSDAYTAVMMQTKKEKRDILAVTYFDGNTSAAAIELGDNGAKALADHFYDMIQEF